MTYVITGILKSKREFKKFVLDSKDIVVKEGYKNIELLINETGYSLSKIEGFLLCKASFNCEK